MKKIYLTTIFFLSLTVTFAQWKKITAIPSVSVVAFVIHNNSIYAASGSNAIYKSTDGLVWKSIIVSTDSIDITSLIFYQNKIYVGTFSHGVFVSANNGISWQKTSFPTFISSFCIRKNVLYASTLGAGVAVLNSITNTWAPFNNSLPDYSINVQSIIGSPNFLIIAAGANGTFYRYNFNRNEWIEKYYFGLLRPGLLINKLINSGDTIWAVNGNRIIKSSDAGVSWIEDKIGTHNGTSRFIYAGATKYYTLTNLFPQGTWIQQRQRNAGIGATWATNEDFFPTGLCYDIIEFNNKLFLGNSDGLYFKSADGALASNFLSFNATCEAGKTMLTWRTAAEQTRSHFTIEKSVDAKRWAVIGDVAGAINGAYFFTDNDPVQNSIYRVAEYNSDGKTQYTNTVHSSCANSEFFSLWPNPTPDVVFITINSAINSQVEITIADREGTLVKVQKTALVQGRNRLRIDLTSLATGVYYLSASWNNGQNQKTTQIVKQ